MAQMQQRHWVMAAALLVTLGLVAWVERMPEEDAQLALAKPERSTDRSAASAPRVRSQHEVPSSADVSEPSTALAWQSLEGRLPVEMASHADLFKSHSWYVPPPPKPVVPVPPPKPVAPPAPYTYMGRMEDTPQGTLLMLSGNNKVYTVAVGETVDKIWRVDGEDAATIRLTHVPLNLPQTLPKAGRPAAAKPNEAKPNDQKKTDSQGTDS